MEQTGKRSYVKPLVLIIALAVFIIAALIYQGTGNEFGSTFWAFVPALIAIGLALITKEIYTSLFVGIFAGALLYANFNVITAVESVVVDGFITSLASRWNMGVFVFLAVLGIYICLVNKAGGTAAYGRWAEKRIKRRKTAILSTIGLGLVLFVDDYFNCLTVGSVMRPVTDRHKVSRAKLAYVIDSTAAPICIIAPISSWAAAVTGVVNDMRESGAAVAERIDGFQLFIQSIPYNFYALLTLTMMIAIAFMKYDFGSMKLHEQNAMNHGDLYTTPGRPYKDTEDENTSDKARVIDLVLPLALLIVGCIVGLMYTGGFFEGAGIVDSFANSNASVGLPFGSLAALLISFIYLFCRRVMPFSDMAATIPNGLVAMIPAILILSFAFALKRFNIMLEGPAFITGIMEGGLASFMNLMPAIVFVIACLISFSIGTSWGTFGMLLPIVLVIMDHGPPELLIIATSACLAGAVFGDHCTLISDTTIMSSAGAKCGVIEHVQTQIPYALFTAALSFVMYLLAGVVQNWLIVLPIGIALTVSVLLCMRTMSARKGNPSSVT
ncbi:MAG: Na+/H+ antiporter NhaC family protein [Oscillospiraceae bacterium]|nr:Na+/H+ antiporter NhaC family protein [Oscillospiraceae bacterium]